MAVLGLNDLIFLLKDDSVLHKIIYILCNKHCCLNKVEMLPFSLEEFFDWNKLDLHILKPEHKTESLVLADDYTKQNLLC